MPARADISPAYAQQRQFVCEQLRLLHRELGRRPNVADYNEFRKRENRKRVRAGQQRVPSMSAVYRMYDKWPVALAAAGIAETTTPAVRASDEELLHDLRYVAGKLGTDELSTSRYDAYRKLHPFVVCGVSGRKRRLYSSSVVRKWVGDWPVAVARAGLRTTGKQQRRPPQNVEVLDWVRRAHREGFSIDAGGWLEFLASLDEEQRKGAPEPNHVIDHLHSFANARRAVGDDSDEVIDCGGVLWFRSEVGALIRSQLEEQTGMPREQAREQLARGISRERYDRLMAQSRRPLPPWPAVERVLGVAA